MQNRYHLKILSKRIKRIGVEAKPGEVHDESSKALKMIDDSIPSSIYLNTMVL